MFYKKEYLTILIIQITEVLGFSLILPFLPFYAQDLGASPLEVGLILSSFSFFQFLSAPVMGKLSDIYGRKPLLVASQLSTFIGFVLLGFADKLWMVYLSRSIDGLLGSNMTIAQAYLSDISSQEDRSKAFGVSGVAFGFGFLIGPALGGWLSSYSFALPSFIAAFVSLLTIFTTLIFLQETVQRDEQARFKLSIINIKAFRHYFSQPRVAVFLWQFWSFIFAHTLWVSTMALYAERQIGLDASHIGFTLAYVGLISILIRGVLLGKLIDRFGEVPLSRAGMASMLAGLCLASVISAWWMFFVVMTFFSFGSGLVRPLIMGEISRAVPPTEQGAAIGITNALQSISQILAPLLGGYLIANFFPGSLGLAGSLLIGLGLALMLSSRTNAHSKGL